MIDKIVKRSWNEYVIVFTHRPPVTIYSSGNAAALLQYFMTGTYG